ncbi:hypothetical protein HHL28_05400 [Aerophototrophica crusticola]|uniref:Uncharacterized protein n=1 Tax=Aerophototrophica crusticola TaxID=1709002 RepID=A0A858R552_9PROT|nr:hypothetical protein HHL28_05400 [Rhodospirillaceae bacterium B3]
MSRPTPDGPVTTGRPAREGNNSPSPMHPGDDPAMPYSPGGIPEPDTDEKGNPKRNLPSYPPKREA